MRDNARKGCHIAELLHRRQKPADSLTTAMGSELIKEQALQRIIHIEYSRDIHAGNETHVHLTAASGDEKKKGKKKKKNVWGNIGNLIFVRPKLSNKFT